MLDAVGVAGRWMSKPLLGELHRELEQWHSDPCVGLRLEDRKSSGVAWLKDQQDPCALTPGSDDGARQGSAGLRAKKLGDGSQ